MNASSVNPADPFGLAAKARASIASAAESDTQGAVTSPPEKEPAAQMKLKRTYVKRGATVSDDTDAELVLGYFSTGGLSIRKGRQTLELTPCERAQLYAFMEKVE